MKIRKRIRPLMRVGEVFQIPQIFLIPGMLVSCGLIPLSRMADSVFRKWYESHDNRRQKGNLIWTVKCAHAKIIGKHFRKGDSHG